MGTFSINAGLSHNERCEELAHPNIGNFVLSWFLLIGILVSYIPQHYRIIHRRTSQGISPYFVLLGTVSGTSAIANILTLPTSRQDIACCKVNSGFSCTAGLLGIAQVGAQWSCFFIITFLFLIFVPRRGLQRHGHEAPAEVGLVPTNEFWQQAVGVVVISIVHFAGVLIISVIMLGAFPKYLQIWANILGIMGSVLASIQYLPQIYTTWTAKTIGSFSIPMMLIQTPGSFVFAASLAVRLGPGGWSAWTVYLVTGVLQGILLAMAIVFSLREHKTQKRGHPRLPEYSDEDDLPNDEDSENDPLIISKKIKSRSRKRLSGVPSPLAPHRLDPEPSSSEDEHQNGEPSAMPNRTGAQAICFENEDFADMMGVKQQQDYYDTDRGIDTPTSRRGTQYYDIQQEGEEERPSTRRATQYYDSHSRRESHDTITAPEAEPIGGRADSPFTAASRSVSSGGSAITAFHNGYRQTTDSGSPNGTSPIGHPRAASSAGLANGRRSAQDEARSKSTAQ